MAPAALNVVFGQFRNEQGAEGSQKGRGELKNGHGHASDQSILGQCCLAGQTVALQPQGHHHLFGGVDGRAYQGAEAHRQTDRKNLMQSRAVGWSRTDEMAAVQTIEYKKAEKGANFR